MDTCEKIISGVSSALGIIAFFIPELKFESKIITILLLLVVSLLIFLIRRNSEYSKLKFSLKEKTKKHKAITKQFDDERKLIKNYQFAFFTLGQLLYSNFPLTPQSRLAFMYKTFNELKNKIGDKELIHFE